MAILPPSSDSDSDSITSAKIKPVKFSSNYASLNIGSSYSSPKYTKPAPAKTPRILKADDDDQAALRESLITEMKKATPPWAANPLPVTLPAAPWGGDIGANAVVHIAQPAPVAPPAPQPPPDLGAIFNAIDEANGGPEPVKLGSLKSFVASGADFDGSQWTNDHVSDALKIELWRARDYDEVIKEGDILFFDATPDQPAFFDQVRGYKEAVLTREMVELHGFIVWTLEGGGKPRKPIIYHQTTEYSSLLSVPKGTFVKMPTDFNEAKRFFESDVFMMDAVDPETRTKVRVYAPMPTQFARRDFRQVFSRVFPDIARKHFKDHIKGLIEGRGLGISQGNGPGQLKRGISINQILDMIDGRKRGVKVDKHKPMTPMQVAAKLGLSEDLVLKVVARRDYKRTEDERPIAPFKQRMDARDLTPVDYRYEKAIGIEIEAITPCNIDTAQSRMPSFVRVTTDGSLRDDKDRKLSPNGANDAASLAKGLDGLWGLEYRMLIKRSEMEVRIIKAANAIHSLGAKVNKSCGLHVHFDMRDKDLQYTVDLGDKLTKWLKCLRELLPASRRANQYCSFDQPANRHHWAVSAQDSYNRHKTLEVRVHSSTLNTTKIINWVRLIETIMETRFLPLGAMTTLDALKALGLSEADRTYWLKRHQQLNPDLYRGAAVNLDFLGDRAVVEVE